MKYLLYLDHYVCGARKSARWIVWSHLLREPSAFFAVCLPNQYFDQQKVALMLTHLAACTPLSEIRLLGRADA